MTTWILLPPFGGSTRIVNADRIVEFVINANSQNIFTLTVSFGGGAYPEPIQLMKTNNEANIKEAINQFFVLKTRSQNSHSDILIEFSNDSVLQKPSLY